MATTLAGTWSAVSTGNGTVYQSGSTTVSGSVILQNGTTLTITSGAIASDVSTTVGGIATVNVLGGGELLNSHIDNGYVYVSSGGVTSGNIFNSDPVYLSAGASSLNDTYYNSGYGVDSVYVASGATLSGAIISSGGSLVVSSGAAVNNLTVYSSGVANLASGTTNDFVASSGGYIASGSSVFSGVVLSGQSGNTDQNTALVLSGTWSAVSTASGTVYQSGSTVASSPVVLANGATLNIMSGATASGLNTVPGGAATVTVSGGGELLNSYIENGYIYVKSGGVTSGNMLNSDPVYISSGGSSVNDIVYNSGFNNDLTYADSGATVVGTIVSSGGILSANSNAIASNISANSGGVVYINGPYGSGAGATLTLPSDATTLQGSWSAVSTANGTVYQSGTATVSGAVTLANGATLNIMSGATASGINTTTGGISLVIVNNGAELTSSYIQNGYVSVNSGGITSGNIFNSDPVYLSSGASSVNDTYYNSGYGVDITYVYSGATLTTPYVSSGGYISVNSGGNIDTPTVTSGGNLVVNGGALDICFLAGTLILTPSGEVPIEKLTAGDEIITYDWENKKQKIQKLIWVGHKKNTFRYGQPDDLSGYPVRICKNAIADGIPHKDLLVTAEHSLFFEGMFIPARMLVNGSSIFYDHTMTSYDIFHIETEKHSVIWSDGALSESYLDTGNRPIGLHSNQTTRARNYTQTWATHGCAPLTVAREVVEPIFHKIHERSKILEFKNKTLTKKWDNDPSFHLVADTGQILYKSRETKGYTIFSIPAGIKSVRLVSRTSRPSDTIGPFVDDRRNLGVLVGKIMLFDAGKTYWIEQHLEKSTPDGWYEKENASCCWTNGNAYLSLKQRDIHNTVVLSVQILHSGPYLIECESACVELSA